ncbi:hypothetical protein SUGI_0524380 [Cryptomeria japonica]|nr:hypothetical protein SUGI_0524380 [Cryptomeria japonica]
MEYGVSDSCKISMRNRFQVAVVKLMVQGCDGSFLIDSSEENTAEKDGPPNLSVHAFFVIDNDKGKLEFACAVTVCCADILALAAGDALVLARGPD